MSAKFTPGPYFVAFDNAEDCPGHKHSGLAMVETGRAEDWPIARLCTWPNARFIALAPDLLHCLKHMCREWREAIGPPELNSTPADTLERAEALIAQIEDGPIFG